MSIVKHLKGHIPIIPTHYNHLDSFNFFKQENFKNRLEDPFFPLEDFIDPKRKKSSFKSKNNSKSLHETNIKNVKPSKKQKKNQEFSIISRYDNETSIKKNNDLLNPKISENILENLNSSRIVQDLRKSKSWKFFPKITSQNSNHNLKINKERVFSSKKYKKNEFFGIMINTQNLKKRLDFLKNSDINRKNDFWNKILTKKKFYGNESILKGTYKEKELKKILEDNRKNSPSNKLRKNSSPKLEPIIRFSTHDLKRLHLKYNKRGKSTILNIDETNHLKLLSEKLIKNIAKLNDFNHSNNLKNYHDLLHLIEDGGCEVKSLKELFFKEHIPKQINPKLDSTLILKSFFINNFKFNHPNNTELIEINKQFVQSCEKLKGSLKEFIFKKKLKLLPKEKEELIHNNVNLIDLQNKVLKKVDLKKRGKLRNNFKKFEKYQSIIGKHNNPYDIMREVHKFEVLHGSLVLTKKTRLLGEELNSMIFGVNSKLIQMDLNDQNVFYSIE